MKRLRVTSPLVVQVAGLNIAVALMFAVVLYSPPLSPPVQAYSLPVHKNSQEAIEATQGTPTQINIPSLDISLPVVTGSYDEASGAWTVNNVDAFYADISLPANDSNGVTLIYGHAQQQIFGSLPNIQLAASAEVTTGNGRVFRYVYELQRDVVPTDISLFRADGPPRLVLQICSGVWDEYRTLYEFRFESVEAV